MVAAEVKAPVAPSRTIQRVGAERRDRVARLAVELLGQPGHQEQEREHHGGADDHRGDPAIRYWRSRNVSSSTPRHRDRWQAEAAP